MVALRRPRPAGTRGQSAEAQATGLDVRRSSLVGLALLLTIATGAAWHLASRTLSATIDPPALTFPVSPLVLDRDGRLLRPFTVADGVWRLPVTLDEVDPRFVAMLLAWEDRRFYDHAGVDPFAVVRALWQGLTEGRVVSGASTITMQLVRLLAGEPTRRLPGKVHQAMAALALERRADKAAILSAYLSLAPYGGNLEGVRSASLAYFGREPRRLTVAESALLVALPQAPEARRPERHPVAARRARDRVLARAAALGLIGPGEADAARREPVPWQRRPFPMLAAHMAERRVRTESGRGVYRLTIDARLQRRLESVARERALWLGPRVSVALLVAEHRRGEILAAVGAAAPFDRARQGFVDMTHAVRSPGSTLKPLIYGLAFELGLAHPESLIEDRPIGFAGYVPTNFDRTFRGTVTVREALQGSLNVPAVTLLEAIGPARLVARLRRAGTTPVLPDRSPPGLAIGLGGVGISLTDLVRLYAAIARGGTAVTLTESLDRPLGDAMTRVLDERAAWYVGAILAGSPAPVNSSPGPLAYKTGTSYGYRDAWAVGFDGRHVVGVWVGRPDGAAVPGLAGIDAAAPILIDAFACLGGHQPLPGPPPDVLIAATADLPPPLQRVSRSGLEVSAAVAAPEIAFPPDGARVELGSGEGGMRELVLKVRNGAPPFLWYANGVPIARAELSRIRTWAPDGPGFTTLAVVDGQGRSSRVQVRLE